MVYGEEVKQEIKVAPGRDGRYGIVDNICQALAEDRPPEADGRWGMATLEVILAVLDSGSQRREIMLSHQVPIRDGI